MATENGAAQSGAETSAPPKGERRWTVGTLTYTSVGLIILFCWLLWGDFAWTMKERAVNPVAMVMLRGFSAPDWLVGLLIGSIPAAIGLILGPVVSVMSDRHRSRWGRRIPFLLFPTPIVTLTMFGLAAVPMIGSWVHEAWGPSSPGEMACRIIVFAFFWTAFEISSAVVNTLVGALINDVVPREVIGRFFALFRAVSLIAGIVFNFFLMGKAESHSFAIFIGLGLLYGIGFSLMCLKVREGSYPPPEPRPVTSGLRFFGPVKAYLKECFTNPFYLWFFLATTLGMLSLGPVNTFSVFHSRSVGMSDDLYGKCLALSYTISLLIAYPLGILADRFHPLRLGLLAMGGYVAATLFGFFFSQTVATFFAAFLAHTVISGTYLTVTASIGQRLLPKAKFAQFASAGGLVTALCFMVLPPALGVFIEWMNHEYRYVFILGCLIACGSFFGFVMLLRGYQRLGGDAGFQPPETVESPGSRPT